MNTEQENIILYCVWISGFIIGYAFAVMILGSYLNAVATIRRDETYEKSFNRKASPALEPNS